MTMMETNDELLLDSETNLSEYEKQQAGMSYDAAAPEVLKGLRHCEQECFEINQLPPDKRDERHRRLKKLFGKTGERLTVITPFFCDYGYHIEVGENFFANVNCVILDETKVTFGDNVFIGPNCSFYTASHPLDAESRNANIATAHPISVGNDVWIGGSVTVLPGVSIGNNVTIGAGSVVVHDIPDNSLAVGNPCKVIRKLG